MAGIVDTVYKSVDDTFMRPEKRLKGLNNDIHNIDYQNTENVQALKAALAEADEFMRDAQNIKVSFGQEQLLKPLNDYISNAQYAVEMQQQQVQDEFNRRVKEIQERYSKEAQEQNDRVIYEFEKGNEVYLRLEEKRKKIAEREEEIVNICKKNGVTTSDVNLNNESYPLDKWNEVYDAAIAFADKTSFQLNPVTKVRDYLDNDVAEVALSAFIIFLCFMPGVLDVVAVAAFLGICFSESNAKKKMEQCAILLGLLYNVRPLEMGYQDKVDEDKLISMEDLVNESPEAQEALAWLNEQQEELAELDLEDYVNKAKIEFRQEMPKINEYVQKKMKGIVDVQKEIVEYGTKLKKEIEAKIKHIIDNVKKLGDDQSYSVVYRNKYMLGMRDGVIPEYIEIGMQNVVIRPCKDLQLYKTFIQAMLINAYCNVTPTNLNVYVSDPNDLGRDLIGFYNKNTDSVFKAGSSKKLDDMLKPLIDIARDNIKQLRGQELQAYNKECEETGKSAILYNLLIILSQSEMKSEELVKFMEYSASAGVFIWIVTEQEFKNTYVFDKPFQGVRNPIKFDTVQYIRDFGDKFAKRVSDAKPAGLPWKQYLARAFNRERDLWKETTNEFVWFEPGFINGDPAKYNHYTLGNSGDVHAVITGTSGAGKSVFINQLICNMTLRHSPEELRLWLVDFKGSEFSLYLKSDIWPYQLPHIDACLCTSDPDFSRTLFTALKDESERRYNLLKNNKFRNIVEWNDAKRKEGKPELCIPRIIFIADEFQVIFTKADAKTISSVTQDITIISKVARAAGVHLVFASQSMKGTVSDDILNMFTLRFCLRCEQEVSMQILGTPYAGNIREKFGFLYVRSIDDAKKELQNRYKTPFQTNDELKQHIKDMDETASARGYVRGPVIEYDENTVHSIDEMDGLYEQIEDKVNSGAYPKAGTVFLGRRMVYDSNLAPANFILTAKAADNIMTAFQDQKDMINWFLSFQKNIDHWKGAKSIVYNSQSDDLMHLLYFDQIVPKPLQQFMTRKTTMQDIYDMADKIYQKRKSDNIKDTPVIFICVNWASTVGFGVDSSYKFVEKLSTLLQVCGEYHMHFVFIDTKRNDVPTSVIKACNFRICGKCDSRTATSYTDSELPSKPTSLENGYAFLAKGQELSKFKIYQSKLDRKVQELEIRL